MSFADRFKRFFKGAGSPDLERLEPFAAERKGIEGFIEPQTATQPITLLLVDRDGDYVRAPVRDVRDAVRFCETRGIPIYDAQVIGYPKRMKDFDAGRRPRGDLDEKFAEIEQRLRDEGPSAD